MIFKELAVVLLLAMLAGQITSSEDLKVKLEEKKLALLEKVKGGKKTDTTPAAETPAVTPADKPDKTAPQKTPGGGGGRGRPNCGNGGGGRTRGQRGGGGKTRGQRGRGGRTRGRRGGGGRTRGRRGRGGRMGGYRG